jgi:hypothetical protein
MGEGYQEVKFWRWLMDIRKLKVLVFRQFFHYYIIGRRHGGTEMSASPRLRRDGLAVHYGYRREAIESS